MDTNTFTLDWKYLLLFRRFKKYSGDSARDTPVPIPNTEVKPSNADGTRRETSRETRKLSPVKRSIDASLSLSIDFLF